MLALVLTVIFPGLGHFYYGKNRKGLILAFISFIPFVYPFSLIYALYDIIKLNKSRISPELSKREAIVAIFMIILVPAIFAVTMAVTIPKVVRSVSSYFDTRTVPDLNTETMNDIAARLEKYYETNRKYPVRLSEIIRDNPLRKNWETDPWGSRYVYITNKEKTSFQLISKGKDREEDTADDIVIRNISRE